MNGDAGPLGRTIAGHPAGIWLVAFTEMWERFSYWGFAGILVLFLTAAQSGGGWGWQDEDALRLYGWYGGLAFIVPVLGAWLANNHLGERRCILWGGVLIVLGHAAIACVWLVPALLDRAGGTDAVLVLREANVTLGLPFPGEGVRSGIEEQLRSSPDSGLTLEQVLAVYLAKSWGFLASLLLIIAGTGLLKPAISSIVASLYPEGGTRRDEGFAFFFTGIYLGALLGALVTGVLGEKLGWHYGLTAAGIGMAAGLAAYIAKQKRWLGDLGTVPRRVATSAGTSLSRSEWARIGVIVVQGAFTVLYAAGFYQMFGLLNLYAHEQLDRTLGGFEIPTTWMQTISLWSFFICIPLLAWVWRRLAASGRNPSASYKLALGLAVLALGYLVIAAGESARDAEKTALVWLVATYLLFGLGDALVWPNQISLTSKLAPERYTAMAVGSWYICIGLGTWLTGYVGAIASRYPSGDVFLALATACGLAGLLLAALTPALKKLIPGFEE